jgi:hypothetical protein
MRRDRAEIAYAPREDAASIAVENDSRGSTMTPTPPRRPQEPAPAETSSRRSLGECCRELGLDAHGQRCPVCPLKVLCMTETRWRVPREPRPRRLI